MLWGVEGFALRFANANGDPFSRVRTNDQEFREGSLSRDLFDSSIGIKQGIGRGDPASLAVLLDPEDTKWLHGGLDRTIPYSFGQTGIGLFRIARGERTRGTNTREAPALPGPPL